MKHIRLTCWFTNSEEWLAKLVICEGYKISIRKIIDPLAIITGRGRLCKESYDIFGFDKEVNRLKLYLENGDFDVEIIEQG